nr:Gag-Pol polyprotein [Tanacetum cinerariifolium]
MQTQTSNTLHNAIMEAGGKDRPPMLAPDKYANKDVLVTEGSSETTTERYMENYKNVSQDIRDQLNAEAEAKAIKRLKEGESINVQDHETNLYWEFRKFTLRDGESLESYYSRSQKAATKNRSKAIFNSSLPIYDQEPFMVAEDDEMSKDKEIDKLMALISLSFKKIYKSTNNNLQTLSNTSRANQDNSPRINRGTGYDNQRIVNVTGARETVEIKTGKGCSLSQGKDAIELEAHYMYMAQIQEVTPDAVDNSGPIFDTDPLQKVPNNDNYNVFAIESEHPEQSKSVNDTYPIEQDKHNVIIDSLDMSYDREQIDQNDDDDLANERDLLASLIEKLKCEIDDSKNRDKFLETLNKVLVDKLKEEMVAGLRYFNSLELEVDSLKSQLETQKTQFLNEIDRLLREYYYAHHMNAILGVYTELDEVTNLQYRVMLTNSQGKKQEVKDHRRNVKFSKNKTSVTACNDSLNAKTSNVNFVCVTCGKCMLIDNHEKCVLHYLNGVKSRTKMPMAVPISTREPKRTINQFVAKPLRRTVASESTNQKSKHKTRKLYEHVSKGCSWWYPKFTPLGYKWKPKSKIENVNPNLVEIILFIIDSGCSKHMTRNLKLLTNFVEKFLGTMKLGNDQIAPILGYGDLVQGAVSIKRVYYVKGLNQNLFSVDKFCDADLEVAFRKSTCYICDLKRNDLLTGSRGTDLYFITLQDTSSPNPICLMAKATSSKDETPKVLIDFFRLVQRGLHAQVRIVRTDKGTDGENLNKMKEKGDTCIFVGYSTQSRAYRVFNKRKRVIVETFHVNIDELPQMVSDQVSSDPVPQFEDDEFINIFCTPVQDRGETSSRHVDSSNMHTFYQRHPSEHRWTKDHPLEQVIGNPSQSVKTRRRLESDGEMCMFALTVSRTEPKNIKEAMADSAWIESMQEGLHQFDRLDVWELVDRPLCKNVINMKWLWKNKRDEENIVIQNKSHLVAKGYAQKEGVDFKESFVPLVEIVLFIVDSGCSKHMTGNLKLLINFVEKFLGTVKFRNDQITPILGYGDLVQGAVTIKKVYYVEGLNHNLFFVGQFCDADLEVAFRKSTCFIRDLKGNDLLTGSRRTDLYSITLQDTNSPNPICLMAKATSSRTWLWHRRLSHLNFDTINLLSKNDIVVGLPKLKFVKDHLCSSSKPTEKHLTAVKRIFWYLKDTFNMGLWHPKDTGFELTAFSDSDHAGCLDSRKSTSGGIQFLGGDNEDGNPALSNIKQALESIPRELPPAEKCINDLVKNYNIKQRDEESTEEFVQRYKLECKDVKGAQEFMKILGFMDGITNLEFIKCLHDKIPKKDQAKTVKKGKTSRKDNPLAILMVQPSQMVAKQRITQTSSLELVISFPPLGEEDGMEGPMIIEAEIFRPEVRSQMVPATTPLIGFSGEIIWPLGEISLLVKIGDEEHSTSVWMNFMVIRSSLPYNGIIGRPGVRRIQAVPSTAQEMLKFLDRRNGHITKQQDYSMRMHNGFRTRIVAARNQPSHKTKNSDTIRYDWSFASHSRAQAKYS